MDHGALPGAPSAGTHREPAVVAYGRSPQAAYPAAIKQAYAAARRITAKSAKGSLRASHLAVPGGPVSGHTTAALTLMARQPTALVIVDENDVPRDESETCARELTQATTTPNDRAAHAPPTAARGT
ncbi:alpha/beta hydrolase fold domain-containing protein [Streptomyces sp. NPDC002306]